MFQNEPAHKRLRPLRWLVSMSALVSVALLLNWLVPTAWAQEFVFLPLLRNGQSRLAVGNVTPAAASDEAIQLVAAVPEMADWLALHPGWVGEAYQDDNNQTFWYVYFYLNRGQENEEWLGEGQADLSTNTVPYYFAPRELTPEEFAFGLQKIQTYLKYDPETAARFGNTSIWARTIQYNRWRGVWEAIYTKQPVTNPPARFIASLDINRETKRVYLNEIQDAQALDARDQRNTERNQAIQLTWQADGVGEAVAGHDNIEAYVEPTAVDGQYTVEFHDNATLLFWAFVDVYQWQVLDAGR